MLPLVIYLSHFSQTERKELKACVLLWCGKSLSPPAPSAFVSFMFHASEEWSFGNLDLARA